MIEVGSTTAAVRSTARERAENRITLGFMILAACSALACMAALAGVPGVGLGICLLVVGGVGLVVLDDVLDDLDDGNPTDPGASS